MTTPAKPPTPSPLPIEAILRDIKLSAALTLKQIKRECRCPHNWRDAGQIGPGTTRSICLTCGQILIIT